MDGFSPGISWYMNFLFFKGLWYLRKRMFKTSMKESWSHCFFVANDFLHHYLRICYKCTDTKNARPRPREISWSHRDSRFYKPRCVSLYRLQKIDQTRSLILSLIWGKWARAPARTVSSRGGTGQDSRERRKSTPHTNLISVKVNHANHHK